MFVVRCPLERGWAKLLGKTYRFINFQVIFLAMIPTASVNNPLEWERRTILLQKQHMAWRARCEEGVCAALPEMAPRLCYWKQATYIFVSSRLFTEYVCTRHRQTKISTLCCGRFRYKQDNEWIKSLSIHKITGRPFRTMYYFIIFLRKQNKFVISSPHCRLQV